MHLPIHNSESQTPPLLIVSVT
ncbi:hypothetical protein YPPY08_3224, partial [Yersinia pestis PY-08]